jgi:hypothetical protein
VQAVLDRHDTPCSTTPVAPRGLEVLWIDHIVPLQRSTNVPCWPALLVKLPTAAQAVLDVHDTPFSVATLAPRGLGARWIVHVAPFQTSARALLAEWIAVVANPPTAAQNVFDVHDTPLSSVRVAPRVLRGR